MGDYENENNPLIYFMTRSVSSDADDSNKGSLMILLVFTEFSPSNQSRSHRRTAAFLLLLGLLVLFFISGPLLSLSVLAVITQEGGIM